MTDLRFDCHHSIPSGEAKKYIGQLMEDTLRSFGGLCHNVTIKWKSEYCTFHYSISIKKALKDDSALEHLVLRLPSFLSFLSFPGTFKVFGTLHLFPKKISIRLDYPVIDSWIVNSAVRVLLRQMLNQFIVRAEHAYRFEQTAG